MSRGEPTRSEALVLVGHGSQRHAESAAPLHHHADEGVPRDDLELLDGPVALRAHVRHDDAGRYRPLSGAATLPTGWTLPRLDESAMRRAVDFVYPASIAHWYRARTGDPDVTDFGETVARQTGIYAGLAGLDRDELEAATEAVCGSCVRQRRWKADESAADTDEGAIPCREACPYFLSAAHAFAESGGKASGEPDTGVTAGALENPGNEYRVRYARAQARRGNDEPAEIAASPAGGDGR